MIAVVGDGDVADRGGVLDLRIRKARRRGAHLMIVGPGGSLSSATPATVRQTDGATTAQALADLVRDPRPAGHRDAPRC